MNHSSGRRDYTFVNFLLSGLPPLNSGAGRHTKGTRHEAWSHHFES